MNEDFDSFRQSVIKAVGETHERFQRLSDEVVEYKKTVNNALALLSKELLDFIDQDVKERKRRQLRTDVKDVAIGCLFLLTLIAICSILSLAIYVSWSVL